MDLAALKSGKSERGTLLRAIDTLTELHESATAAQLNDRALQPVWSLVELINQPESEIPATKETEVVDRAKPRGLTEAQFESHFPHVEPIEAFPPEVSEQDIIDDFRAISDRNPEHHPIEWERISSFMILKQELQNAGHKVKALRLIQTDWHPLPHYVLEVSSPQGTVAIIESPIYAHATYTIASGEWRAVVTSGDHKAVREYNKIGVRVTAKVHAAGKTAAHHRKKLRDEANISL